MQPLTGSEIQQLSIHNVLKRKYKCWCCGGIRKVIIIDSKLAEVCILSSVDVKYRCPYGIIELDENDRTVCLCITPDTSVGNCNGLLKPSINIKEFYEFYNNIENFIVSKRTLSVVHKVDNLIVNKKLFYR